MPVGLRWFENSIMLFCMTDYKSAIPRLSDYKSDKTEYIEIEETIAPEALEKIRKFVMKNGR